MKDEYAKTYTDRELDQHFRNMLEHMTSFEAETGASLRRIEAQTSKTNGRVSKLENWRYFIMGGLAILSILMVPLVIYVLKQQL